jgi:ketosteroid isomerase-like protein
MAEESTTPDLIELGDRLLEAANRRDLDALMSFFAPDAVRENAGDLGTIEGEAAIRRFWQDWFASYEEFWIGREEAFDLGNGVVFSVVIQKARLVGSSGEVRQRSAVVTVWVDGLIVRATFYLDIDAAGAAAQRLAQERG